MKTLHSGWWLLIVSGIFIGGIYIIDTFLIKMPILLITCCLPVAAGFILALIHFNNQLKQ